MTSNNISPEQPKEKLTKVCPYLGLLQDSQTTLSFPSGSNLCYHAKPLASPSLEYQRSVCLKGRRHTLCPVFSRSELAPLPPEITGSPANKLFSGKPIEKRVLLPILLGILVLVLAGIGLFWFLNSHGGINAAGSPTPTASATAMATATLSVTVIPITPNVDLTAIPDTATPFATAEGTETAQTFLTPTRIVVTSAPFHTQVPCGSPNTWVVYIVRPGDNLYSISLLFRVTVAQLQQANCLGTSSILHTGQILYVPPWAPLVRTPTQPILVIPTFTPTQPILVIPTFTPTDTQVLVPSDTATQPPVDTATEVPSPTDVPTDTLVSP
jgi:LysM repeat protein